LIEVKNTNQNSHGSSHGIESTNNKDREYAGKIRMPVEAIRGQFFAGSQPVVRLVMHSKDYFPEFTELPKSIQNMENWIPDSMDDNVIFEKHCYDVFLKDAHRSLLYTSKGDGQERKINNAKHFFSLPHHGIRFHDKSLITAIFHQGLLADSACVLYQLFEPGVIATTPSPPKATLHENENGSFSLSTSLYKRVEIPGGLIDITLQQNTEVAFESVELRDLNGDVMQSRIIATSKGKNEGIEINMVFRPKDDTLKSEIHNSHHIDELTNIFSFPGDDDVKNEINGFDEKKVENNGKPKISWVNKIWSKVLTLADYIKYKVLKITDWIDGFFKKN
jgi:hypothetical protein